MAAHMSQGEFVGIGMPAVFVDRDGTIIEDKGHLATPDDVVFYPYSFEALRLLQERFSLFIVTNQSGVSLGKITRADADVVNEFVVDELNTAGIRIQKLYCCSHKREDNCDCIKPKPFFIREAQREFGVDVARSYTVGDHPHDVDFGRNAGAMGLYVLTGHGRKHQGDLPAEVDVFENLLDAAHWMVRKCAAAGVAV